MRRFSLVLCWDVKGFAYLYRYSPLSSANSCIKHLFGSFIDDLALVFELGDSSAATTDQRRQDEMENTLFFELIPI
jgi:hypothetical protein